jgi:hypothetical protein
VTTETRIFVYFKDEAKRLGMDNVKSAADIEIWCYIMKHQKDTQVNSRFMQEHCNG